MNSTCRLCQSVQDYLARRPERLIYEFSSSILIVGDHQFFAGYSLLIYKQHVREMHDLPAPENANFWTELTRAAKAIDNAFRPLKMNYACLGNQDPHLHWHLFPRSSQDPHSRQHPWFDAERFSSEPTTANLAQIVAERVRQHLV